MVSWTHYTKKVVGNQPDLEITVNFLKNFGKPPFDDNAPRSHGLRMSSKVPNNYFHHNSIFFCKLKKNTI